MTSKSHTFQDHHGDVQSRLSSRARRDRAREPRRRTVSFFLAFFQTVPRPFPVSLFLSFFLIFESERFQFPFLVSLLFLFVLVHGHFCSLFCSGWLLDFQAPFLSSQYVLPLENYTSMTSVDCRVISSSRVYSLTK